MTELQRARILRAMAEAVADQDAGSVTVADVVARAGVSRRTFYEYFADRDECFRATFEWGVTSARAVMAEAYAGQTSWLDGIRAALAVLLDLMDDEPALARLCVVRALGGGAEVLQRRAEALAVLVDFVDRGRLERSTGSEPPTVTAEGVVGAVMSVLHTRLLAHEVSVPPAQRQKRAHPDDSPQVTLSELRGQLMSLIVLPYLGASAARRELSRPSPIRAPSAREAASDHSLGTSIGLTYRTTRVLMAIAERPGVSNREVADLAGIVDQGQISRLLRRLESQGLIANTSDGTTRGAPNAWLLTAKGEQVERGVHVDAQRLLDTLRK